MSFGITCLKENHLRPHNYCCFLLPVFKVTIMPPLHMAKRACHTKSIHHIFALQMCKKTP
eukprot:c17556_g1_i1 orf=456-635(-)